MQKNEEKNEIQDSIDTINSKQKEHKYMKLPYLSDKTAYILKIKSADGKDYAKGVTLDANLAYELFDNDQYGIDSLEEANVFTENIETPQFEPFNNDNFAQAITEAGIKAAKATHEFNMKEIKAKLIADLCTELVKTPIHYKDVPQIAREIADKALENL